MAIGLRFRVKHIAQSGHRNKDGKAAIRRAAIETAWDRNGLGGRGMNANGGDKNRGRLALVRQFEIRKTSKQDNYGALRLNLGRAGGFAEVEAKIWGLDHAAAPGQAIPAVGDAIEVIDCKEDAYQGQPQWILRRWRVLPPDEREAALEAFVPPTRIDARDYQRRLDALIEQTDPARVAGMLARDFFDSADFRQAFATAPAAVRHHQSYPGGLLEHTVNVTTLALAMADAYVGGQAAQDGLSFEGRRLAVDRQVLVGAGLLHDIGKIETYRMAPLAEITDAQAWEGHLAIGYAQTRARAESLLGPTPSAEAAAELAKLLHCILAHHGKLEFGSPVAPACVEAYILSQADMTDARLAEIAEGAVQAIGQRADARWLGRSLHFPSGVFIGDWTAG
jgi:3'-5' exoribonuclease